MHASRRVRLLAPALRLASAGGFPLATPCNRRPAFRRLFAAIGVHHSMSISPRTAVRHAAGGYRFVGRKITATTKFANGFSRNAYHLTGDAVSPPQIFFKKSLCIGRGFGYKPRTSSAAECRASLGNRLTVDPRTLTPLVLVRIQVPQPILPKRPDSLVFQSCRIPFWHHWRPDAQN